VEPGRQPVCSVGSALWISHHRSPATQGDLSSAQSQGVDRNNLGDFFPAITPGDREFAAPYRVALRRDRIRPSAECPARSEIYRASATQPGHAEANWRRIWMVLVDQAAEPEGWNADGT
jgi:hypothetical protein